MSRLRTTLTRSERVWAISQVLRSLVPKYGLFPLEETVQRRDAIAEAKFRISEARRLRRFRERRKARAVQVVSGDGMF